MKKEYEIRKGIDAAVLAIGLRRDGYTAYVEVSAGTTILVTNACYLAVALSAPRNWCKAKKGE